MRELPWQIRQFGTAYSVFQPVFELLAGDVHNKQRISERHHRTQLAHRNITFINRGANTSAIREGNIGVFQLFGFSQHAVGNQIAQVRLLGTDILAFAVKLDSGNADNLLHHFFQFRFVRSQHILRLRVLLDRVVYRNQLPAKFAVSHENNAVFIKLQIYPAEELAPFIRLNDDGRGMMLTVRHHFRRV
ncbi:Uncharacterised protein [Actinobacillus pleuropneumoniae]|nr:Uncharacterised protein [Actinobacillus pleuropneumoniae]